MNSKFKGDIGENAVNALAFETYLKYWCFPNPKDERGNKKEICDLLILFKNTAIIISVKNYSFKGNYQRYFRSTLKKALAQINGAERKLFKKTGSIFIKHSMLGEIEFDPSDYTKIQRIIINLNDVPLFYPGGKITANNNFAHIFNWESFLGIVNELNTIPDLISYLEEREKIFKEHEITIMKGNEEDWDIETNKAFFEYNSGNRMQKNFILISGNELDILADYFTHNRKFNKHLSSKEFDGASFQFDDKWKTYLEREEVKRKKKEDQESYFVDEFVKREVLYKNDKQNIHIATELLSLNRFERRILGKSFFEFVDRYKNENGYFVGRRYGTINNIVIVFLVHGHQMEHDHIMASMQLAIEGYCYWDKYKLDKIIIIAVSNKLIGFKFGYLEDIKPFTQQHEKELIADLKLLKWFQNIENIHFNYKEYP